MTGTRAVTIARDHRVLDTMQPALVHEVVQLAAALGMTESAIRSTLDRLVRTGQVVRVEPTQHGLPVGWRRR